MDNMKQDSKKLQEPGRTKAAAGMEQANIPAKSSDLRRVDYSSDKRPSKELVEGILHQNRVSQLKKGSVDERIEAVLYFSGLKAKEFASRTGKKLAIPLFWERKKLDKI